VIQLLNATKNAQIPVLLLVGAITGPSCRRGLRNPPISKGFALKATPSPFTAESCNRCQCNVARSKTHFEYVTVQNRWSDDARQTPEAKTLDYTSSCSCDILVTETKTKTKTKTLCNKVDPSPANRIHGHAFVLVWPWPWSDYLDIQNQWC